MRRLAILAGAVALAALPASTLATEEDDLAAAREATEAYRDVTVAAEDGYALPSGVPLEECIVSTDGTGAMGFHHINGDLVGDAMLDPATPEALVYEPGANGRLELAALEYVVFAEAWDAENDAPPVLFEQELMLTHEPNRYELPAFYALHVWMWKNNPSGLYAMFNPDVTCPDAVPDTAVGRPMDEALPPLLGAVLLAACVGAQLASRRSLRFH